MVAATLQNGAVTAASPRPPGILSAVVRDVADIMVESGSVREGRLSQVAARGLFSCANTNDIAARPTHSFPVVTRFSSSFGGMVSKSPGDARPSRRFDLLLMKNLPGALHALGALRLLYLPRLPEFGRRTSRTWLKLVFPDYIFLPWQDAQVLTSLLWEAPAPLVGVTADFDSSWKFRVRWIYEPAWIANVVAEVQTHILDELDQRHAAKLQRIANHLKRLLREHLPLTLRERNQLRFWREMLIIII